MPKVRRCSYQDGTFAGWMIDCPGCGMSHLFDKRWEFNGDMEKPSFTPSMMAKWNHGEEMKPMACHSYVTDGRIQFLSDCTHELAGQTVDLPNSDYPED